MSARIRTGWKTHKVSGSNLQEFRQVMSMKSTSSGLAARLIRARLLEWILNLEDFSLSSLCILNGSLSLPREDVQPLLFVNVPMVLCRVVTGADRDQVHLN